MREDVILASSSPRRIEMFRDRGFDPRVIPADIDECLPFDMPPETAVMYLSLSKALHVARKLGAAQEKPGLIIAADTVVVYEGEIMGKPSDEEEAFAVLSRLRGRTHQVITGVCILDSAADPDGAGAETAVGRGETAGAGKRCLYEVTDVTFGTYSDEELRAYVRTPEPYDKAGGYAIQETFGQYIDHIDGDIDNVIGFPMYRVEPLLREGEKAYAETGETDRDTEEARA